MGRKRERKGGGGTVEKEREREIKNFAMYDSRPTGVPVVAAIYMLSEIYVPFT